MSACYSERFILLLYVSNKQTFGIRSLMCFLSFTGMYFLERYRTTSKPQRLKYLFLSSILFGLSSATRSNGLLLSCEKIKNHINNLLRISVESLVYIAYRRLCESPSPAKIRHFLTYWGLTAILGLVAIGCQVLYFIFGIAAYCPSYTRLR
jgi:hypothetical protein